MSDEPLPAFPTAPQPVWVGARRGGDLLQAEENARYERARAAAWEARLRLAKPALELAAMTIGCACACIRCKTASDRVHEALKLIGDLPPLGEM